jgi:hypothetical protein
VSSQLPCWDTASQCRTLKESRTYIVSRSSEPNSRSRHGEPESPHQHPRKNTPSLKYPSLRYPFDFRQMFLGRQVVRQCTIHCRQRQLRPRYPFVYPRLGARCTESSNPRKFVSSSLSQHQLPSSCQFFDHCPSLSQLQIRRVSFIRVTPTVNSSIILANPCFFCFFRGFFAACGL